MREVGVLDESQGHRNVVPVVRRGVGDDSGGVH